MALYRCARTHTHGLITPVVTGVLLAVTQLSCASATFRTPAGVQPASAEFRGDHYVVICHFDCGQAGVGAVEAAEAAWRLASQLLGPTREIVVRPLSIHLYGTYQDYETVELELTHGQFRNNRAMTHPATLTAHVATHPYLANPVMREFGLAANTLRVVAHEAFHLAALSTHPKTRWLPPWLEEGLATWTETQVLVSLGRAATIAEEPVSSTRAYLLQQRIQRAALPHLRELLSDSIRSLPLTDQYAFYQFFFDFVWTRQRTAVTNLLYSVDNISGRGDSYAERVSESLLGPGYSAVDRLNGEFRAYVNAIRPTWVESRRSFSGAGNTWIQVAFDDDAEIWRWDPVFEPTAELTGRVQIVEGAQANILLALQDGGFVSITIRSNGSISSARHQYSASPSRILAEGPPLASRGSDAPFRIRIEREGITIRVSDAPPMRIAAADVQPTGRWGLSVPPRGNVIWRDVQYTRVNGPAPN